MSGDMPRAEIDDSGLEHYAHDAQQLIAPFLIDQPETGPVRVVHATWFELGHIAVNAADPRITIMIGLKACSCGCGKTGLAMMYTPDAGAARKLGNALIAHADRAEAAAATAAADLLAAAGRPRRHD